MMDKETLKIAYLAGNNDSLEAEINDVILEYFESWYEKTGRNLVKKSNDIHNVSTSEIEKYAVFCIELDRQRMNPVTYPDYLKIG